MSFRSGFVVIVGAPNAGKSTFLNKALGAKVAIASAKPQTTRDNVAGILSDDFSQIVFLDTPGFVRPRDLLHEALAARIHEALQGVDAVLHLRDATRPAVEAETLSRDLLTAVRAPIFQAWNKVDLLSESARKALDREIAVQPKGAAFAISALTGEGIEELIAALRERLPEGPPYYDTEELSDRDLRYLAGEIVREKVFEIMRQEVPYSVVARVEEYQERANGVHFVRVNIYVEHESQKGIVIGRGGVNLKNIGQAARPEIEELAQAPVFLELHVKVRKNWTKRPQDLMDFGYAPPRRPPGGGRGRRK